MDRWARTIARTGIFAGLLMFGHFDLASAQPHFDSIYEASSGDLPGNSCPQWTTTDTASPENPVNNGSALVLNTSVGTENIFFRQTTPYFSIPSLLVVEFRAKFISGSSNSPARSPMAVSVTTGTSVGTLFFINNGEIFLTAPGTLVKGPAAPVATAGAFHTYRLEVTSAGVVRAYHDNVLKLTGSTYSNTSDFGADPAILFGEAASGAFGQSEWEFFRHNGSTAPCTPTPGVEFTTAYDASAGGLPDGACSPWTLIDNAAPEAPLNTSGVLEISTSEFTENMAYVQFLEPAHAPLVVEFRAKLVSGSSNSNIRAPLSAFVTTAPHRGILFSVDEGEFFVTAAGTGTEGIRGPSASLPTSDAFHTYRLEIGANGLVSVFRDGVFTFIGQTYTSASDHGPIPRVGFGEGSSGAQGVSQWQFVRHNGVSEGSDQSPPELFVPADVMAESGPGTEPCSEVFLSLDAGSAYATDNCGDPIVTVSGMPPGGLFPVGETVLTWTATDAVGNSSSATQRVVVNCPVGDILGSALLQCDGQSTPAQGVSVRLLHLGTPFRETTTNASGEYGFADVRHGTYTVAIDAQPGTAVAPDTRLVSLAESQVVLEPFAFTCLLSDLTGQITGTCNGQTVGLSGVTMDLFREDEQGIDVLVATSATDAQGNYAFEELALGQYTIGVVSPLGYVASNPSFDIELATPDGSVAVPPIVHVCQAISAQPRAIGYWKHQVNAHLTGKGNPQESLENMLAYLDAMVVHFNQNLVNPVIVYTPLSANTHDKLLELKQLLTMNRHETHRDRAKQQLLSLLLNVVSAKISQTEIISVDGATVTQAITFSSSLIGDEDLENDKEAKRICELINDGALVPAGMIPNQTPTIAYRGPRQPSETTESATLQLGPVAPNPMVGSNANVELALPTPSVATLQLVDMAGRVRWHKVVAGPGRVSLRVGDGERFEPGIYVLRLEQAGESLTRKFAVVR